MSLVVTGSTDVFSGEGVPLPPGEEGAAMRRGLKKAKCRIGGRGSFLGSLLILFRSKNPTGAFVLRVPMGSPWQRMASQVFAHGSSGVFF